MFAASSSFLTVQLKTMANARPGTGGGHPPPVLGFPCVPWGTFGTAKWRSRFWRARSHGAQRVPSETVPVVRGSVIVNGLPFAAERYAGRLCSALTMPFLTVLAAFISLMPSTAGTVKAGPRATAAVAPGCSGPPMVVRSLQRQHRLRSVTADPLLPSSSRRRLKHTSIILSLLFYLLPSWWKRRR